MPPNVFNNPFVISIYIKEWALFGVFSSVWENGAMKYWMWHIVWKVLGQGRFSNHNIRATYHTGLTRDKKVFIWAMFWTRKHARAKKWHWKVPLASKNVFYVSDKRYLFDTWSFMCMLNHRPKNKLWFICPFAEKNDPKQKIGKGTKMCNNWHVVHEMWNVIVSTGMTGYSASF